MEVENGNSMTAVSKKKIFEGVAELLYKAGYLTSEEKSRMKNIIDQEEGQAI